MDPQAAKRSIPEDNLVNTDNKVDIKSLSKAECKSRKAVIITKCLCEPCPRVYTDTISESILIECKDPHHIQEKEERQNPEFRVDHLLTRKEHEHKEQRDGK